MKIAVFFLAVVISTLSVKSDSDMLSRFTAIFKSTIRKSDIAGMKQIGLSADIDENLAGEFFFRKPNNYMIGVELLSFNEFLKLKPKVYYRAWYKLFNWQEKPDNQDGRAYSIWFVRREKAADFKANKNMLFMKDFMVCNVIIKNGTVKLDSSACFVNAISEMGPIGVL
jgi:hypothetical protein